MFGTRQITAGCHPGSFVALLSAERNAVNADKHWRTRVIYNTSIKQVPILHQQQGHLSLLQRSRLYQAPQHEILQLFVGFTHSQIFIVITVNISKCALSSKKQSGLVLSTHPFIHQCIEIKMTMAHPKTTHSSASLLH